MEQFLGMNFFFIVIIIIRKISSENLYSSNSKVQFLRLDGDIMFGGLFSVHSKKEDQKSKNPCGPIKDDVGMQRLEAMLFAVQKINEERKILPSGLTIGVHIRDTCSSDTFALEQSVDFIRGHIRSLDVSEQMECQDRALSPIAKAPLKPVVGVIGAAASTESIMVANILRLFKVSFWFSGIFSFYLFLTNQEITIFQIDSYFV